MTEFNLSKKLMIENWRDDDWFNAHIWNDDLDKNEIVKLVLDEVSEDIKEFIRLLKDKFVWDFDEKVNCEWVKKHIDKLAGDRFK